MSRLLPPAIAAFCILASPAYAHFGLLIPDREIVPDPKKADIHLTLSFSHPMEGNGMEMARPAAFFAVADGRKTDLAPLLKPTKVYEHSAWQADFRPTQPGLYQFAVEPQPYWEPSEDCFIVHYTKTYVSVFGGEDGWDEPLGLKTEIVPLTRPFGNYRGNLFQGQVLLDGKPTAGVDVEIEFYNQDKKYKEPAEAFVTQVVKTDANGVFSYAVPFAGWWGFAALNTAPEKMPYKGDPKDVELGAVLWAHFVEPVRSGQ